MTTLRVVPATGININNLPADIFAFLTQQIDCDSTFGMILHFRPEFKEAIFDLLKTVNSQIVMQLLFGDWIVGLAHPEPVPENRLDNTIPNINPDDVVPREMMEERGVATDQTQGNQQEQAPEQVQGQTPDNIIEETMADREVDGPETIRETIPPAQTPQPGQIITPAPTPNPNAIIEAPGYVPAVETQPVPDNQIATFIAQKMKNNLSSAASVVSASIDEFNRLWGRLIVLKNKIDASMKPIVSDEKVATVLSELDLIRRDDLVESAQISSATGWLNIITKNIQTEKLADGTIRDIGRMLIKLDLNIVMSESIRDGEKINVLRIQNLTRNMKKTERGNLFACGHVQTTGVCLGGYFEQMFAAVTTGALYIAFGLAVKFIKNPDIRDCWGVAATYFPVVATPPATETVPAATQPVGV